VDGDLEGRHEVIVAISIDGGIVQGATVIEDGDYKVQSVVVIDYDIDGIDLSDITNVPQSDGKTEEAYVNEIAIKDWRDEQEDIVEWLIENYAPRIRHYVGPRGDLIAYGKKEK
jgi:formylmethanofuran dehydrogenase subunit E-like metal-binding protein